MNLSEKFAFNFSLRTWILIFIFIGGLARFYDLTAPWKRKDHYNFGGVYTTWMVRCMKKIPFSESHGIVHTVCSEQQKTAYKNHPPTLILELAAWTDFLGTDAPWALRLFVILFSLLNIYLVYMIALQKMSDPSWAAWAAFFQSLAVGTLYFGSHTDFINEVAVFWTLLSILMTLKDKIHWACLFAIVAGISSWPGFFVFAGIAGYRFWMRKQMLPVLFWGLVGVLCGLALMMWLQQTADIFEFLKMKILRPGYVPTKDRESFYFFKWIYGQIQYWNNLFGPLFFMIFIFSLGRLFVKIKQTKWRDQSEIGFWILLFTGGAVYVIAGQEYFYIHIFLLLYLVPGACLLMGAWISGKSLTLSKRSIWTVVSLGLVTYTYGRYKSSIVHDAINSFGFLVSALGFFYFLKQPKAQTRLSYGFLFMAALFNISQMMNYRNEPALDYEFCKQAHEVYSQTGKPVVSHLDKHFTRDLYCQDIPLVEANQDQ